MTWKSRKDRLQADAAKEETSEAVGAEEAGGGEAKAPNFSLHDTAVEELVFAPNPPEAAPPDFHALDLAGGTHGHVVPEEPHFSSEAPAATEASPLEATYPGDPAIFSPFVPYQPEEPQSTSYTFLDREDVAPGLVSPGEEDDIPRVAPFIVDVPPAAGEVSAPERLVVRIGNLSADFVLTKEVTAIGRPDSAAQSYPDVEIELDDAVSRRHAEIRRRDGGYYLVDMGSTNGTLLNGQKLAGEQEQRLFHGDRIRMGDRTEIIFE